VIITITKKTIKTKKKKSLKTCKNQLKPKKNPFTAINKLFTWLFIIDQELFVKRIILSEFEFK
jgi:hypothetical protein